MICWKSLSSSCSQSSGSSTSCSREYIVMQNYMLCVVRNPNHLQDPKAIKYYLIIQVLILCVLFQKSVTVVYEIIAPLELKLITEKTKSGSACYQIICSTLVWVSSFIILVFCSKTRIICSKTRNKCLCALILRG